MPSDDTQPVAGSSDLTVLFADLSGSTRLYDQLGDEEARQIVARCIDAFCRVVESAGGRVVKTIGDEVLGAFANADQAADAARRIQLLMGDLRPVHGGRLGVRVGFHSGPVLEEAGDVFGDTVNTAARIIGLAKAGEILTSRAAQRAFSDKRTRTRRFDRRELRGKQEQLEIVEVIWQTADLTTTIPAQQAAPAAAETLRVDAAGRSYALDAGGAGLTIGRDEACDIVLADPMVSRQHARIEHRHGKFVLSDESANGTLVHTEGGETLRLHREELILQGAGSIGLHDSGGGELLLAFRVEKTGA